MSFKPWQLTWPRAALQVTRLVAVMEERKVFGTSGSKTLKELLAEAETPSKKLSARTGAPPATNGAHESGQCPYPEPNTGALILSSPAKQYCMKLILERRENVMEYSGTLYRALN